MTYPKELPVFEITKTNYGPPSAAKGDHVEGYLDGNELLDSKELRFYCVDDPRDDLGALYGGVECNAVLHPLTPAARAMLAIAKAGR